MSRDRDADLPRELIRKLGELGLLAPMVDPRFGGSGLDYVSLGIAHEELARGDFNAAYVLLIAALIGAIVARNGDERQHANFLPPICRGDFITALAVTEPGGGSDAAHIKMQARRDGDTYLLNGEKTSISFASSAATALVMARTGTLEQGARGVSAFYVDLNSPGVSRTRFRDLGSRAVGRGSLFFDSVRVPADSRIGAEGAGFIQVMQGFDFSRSMIGLMCIGAAQQSVDETCAYVTERQAFGGSSRGSKACRFRSRRPRCNSAPRACSVMRRCGAGTVMSRTDGSRRELSGGRRNSPRKYSINACCCMAI